MIGPARGSVAAALLGVASLARAQPTAPARANAERPAAVEHRVDFHAEQVEIDPESGALVLKGTAVVRAHRFRLTSGERLTLTRSTRGLHVRGAGRLGLCACENPPIAFGFSAADLAPPTDVLLQGATLQIGSVPVFYAPYFWLRSPDRAGLVPPSLAYRGEEGVVLGSGLHLPFGDDRGMSSLSFGLFGYSRGGGRARFELATPHGRATFAADHLAQTGMDVRANLATSGQTGSSVALRADWLAGERARAALARIDRVALPSDRVRLGVGRAESGVLGFQMMADSRRADSLGRLGRLGPGVVLGRAIPLGPSALSHASLASQTAHTTSGALFRGRADAGVAVAIALSPAIIELSARERVEVATRAASTASELSSDLGSRVGFPLVRRYGALLHSLEPLTEAALVGALRNEPISEPLLADDPSPQSSMAVLAGVESALGETGGRSALDLRLGAGLAGSARRPEGVASGRLRADTRIFRAHAEGRTLPEARSAELTLRTEIGQRSQFRVGARADAKIGDATLPRRMWGDDAVAVRVSPLDRTGWSVGGRLGVPWGLGFDTELSSDFDLVAGRWVSAGGTLGYRHPCRCLSLLFLGSRRVGRSGFDAELSVELVP